MISKFKFGESLHLLLSALSISNNRLSKGINVDSSLISRWLHEQRIPSYHSKHIENIALFLSQSILNLFQEQRLNEAINLIYENPDEILGTKDRVMKALLKSQGYSLEGKKIETTKKLSLNPIQIINLSKEDYIVIGSKNILLATLSLIEIATHKKCKNHNMIYISYSNNIDISNFYEDFIDWRDVVLKSLTHGYTVKFLFKVNRKLNLNMIINFLHFAKPLIETGRFLPYYYNAYDTFDLGSESTIIPGIGALTCLSTNANSEIDSAFYMKNQVVIDILSDNFNTFISTSCKSLSEYYTLDHNDSFIESESIDVNYFRD